MSLLIIVHCRQRVVKIVVGIIIISSYYIISSSGCCVALITHTHTRTDRQTDRQVWVFCFMFFVLCFSSGGEFDDDLFVGSPLWGRRNESQQLQLADCRQKAAQQSWLLAHPLRTIAIAIAIIKTRRRRRRRRRWLLAIVVLVLVLFFFDSFLFSSSFALSFFCGCWLFLLRRCRRRFVDFRIDPLAERIKPVLQIDQLPTFQIDIIPWKKEKKRESPFLAHNKWLRFMFVNVCVSSVGSVRERERALQVCACVALSQTTCAMHVSGVCA